MTIKILLNRNWYLYGEIYEKLLLSKHPGVFTLTCINTFVSPVSIALPNYNL